jgi:hypothetical protein
LEHPKKDFSNFHRYLAKSLKERALPVGYFRGQLCRVKSRVHYFKTTMLAPIIIIRAQASFKLGSETLSLFHSQIIRMLVVPTASINPLTKQMQVADSQLTIRHLALGLDSQTLILTPRYLLQIMTLLTRLINLQHIQFSLNHLPRGLRRPNKEMAQLSISLFHSPLLKGLKLHKLLLEGTPLSTSPSQSFLSSNFHSCSIKKHRRVNSMLCSLDLQPDLSQPLRPMI